MHPPSASRIVGAAIFVLVSMLCRPAAAFTVSPDAKSIAITGADVGKSFAVDWSKEIGNCRQLADLTATSTWNVLGLNANKLTLSISMTNTTATAWWGLFKAAITSFGVGSSPNATGAYGANGEGDVFDAAGHGFGAQQSFPGGFKQIDACFSSGNGCHGGSFWSGLQTGVTDTLMVVLAGNFSGGLVTLGLFPLKFKTTFGSYSVAGVVSAVPLPATLPLLAAAIGGLGLIRRRHARCMASRA